MTVQCSSSRLPDDDDWAELTTAQTPLADPAWLRCFAAAFGAEPIVHRISDGGRVVAAVPLVSGDGIARTWTSLDNEHSPYLPLAGKIDDDAAECVLGHLLDSHGVVFLRRLPLEDAASDALVEAARSMRLHNVRLASDAGDARIVLDGSWVGFRNRLSKNFQRDIPRKTRQLEKRGRLELVEHVEPGPALDAALRACFELETRGWKGNEGSPIQRDPRTLRFYGSLARSLAARRRFSLYTLTLDRQLIAFEYCLRGGGQLEMLKLSFDPAFEQQSPGHVLRLLLLERELERGEVGWYHLGRPSPWKLRWATEVAPLCSLRIYGRSPRGNAAYLLGPVLRHRLKASPVVRELHARWRRLQARWS